MTDTIRIVLDDLAEFAADVAGVLGHSPAGAFVQVASIILFDAAEKAHVVTAAELAQIQRNRATGVAAGQAALRESHQDFVRGCVACAMPLKTCIGKRLLAGSGCCAACQHP